MTISDTPRLHLRLPCADDKADLVRELNNFEITKQTGTIPFPYTEADADQWLAKIAGQHEKSFTRVLVLRDSGTMIGVAGIQFDADRKEAELGYWISQSVWGQGYATEAAQAVVNHGFEVIRHHLIMARYNTENPASGRVLDKLGFVRNGMARASSKALGSDVDVALCELRFKRRD